jgi:hypothetical protein
MKQVSDSAALRHNARVFLAQSKHFSARGHRAFAFTLLQWAANARRASQQPQKNEQLPLC